MEAMENGMIDILIMWENLEVQRLTLRDNDGNTCVENVPRNKVSGQKYKNDSGQSRTDDAQLPQHL